MAANAMIVNVLLPANGKEYEFRVPLDSTVDDATSLIARILAARERALYEVSGEEGLVLRQGEGKGQEVNPKATFASLKDQGILTDGVLVALA